jgi:hypothetical protein
MYQGRITMTAIVANQESYAHHACVVVHCSRCGRAYEFEEDFCAHFDSREEAEKAIRDSKYWSLVGEDVLCWSVSCVGDPEEGIPPPPDDGTRKPSFLDQNCVTVACAECDTELLGMEDMKPHFDSIQEAAQDARENDWEADAHRALCWRCAARKKCEATTHAWPEDPQGEHQGIEYRFCHACGARGYGPNGKLTVGSWPGAR